MYELTTWRGDAASFHGRVVEVPVRPAVWSFEVTAPALALGSTQSSDVVDAAACARAGIEVVHRRSGGGAVLLVPGEIVWFDVVVPIEELRAAGVGDDIGHSMVWLGGHVARAVRGLTGDGAPPVRDVEVHDQTMVTTPWSRLVCFDGLGPGEVTVPAGKLVGISQRRTRHGARFQCAVHVRWSPAAMVGLLAGPRPEPGELSPVATLAPAAARSLPAAVAAHLTGAE